MINWLKAANLHIRGKIETSELQCAMVIDGRARPVLVKEHRL